MEFIVPGEIRRKLETLSMIGKYKPAQRVKVKCAQTNNQWVEIPDIISITGSREVGVADTMEIVIENRNGKYSPESKNPDSPWLHVLTPNTEINVELGYGNYLVQYFRGFISDVEMTSFPQYLHLTCISKYKLALDNMIIVDNMGKKIGTVIYRDEYLDDIFIDLALRAGWEPNEIIVEEENKTGIKMSEIEFSWESYADAFSYLSELSQFEVICDEYGQIKFMYPTIAQPAVVNQPIILEGITPLPLDVDNIIEGSDYVLSENKEVRYKRDIDYKLEYDETLKQIVIYRTPDSSIQSGETVLLSYVFPAWVFREGYDLIGISYKLSDESAYTGVLVIGEKESIVTDENGDEKLQKEVIEAYVDYHDTEMSYYGNIINKLYKMPTKILKIDSHEANTVEQCRILAERALRMCNKRYRNTRQTAIAIPWLAVGDTIQVLEESTTISEAYRITSMDISFTKSGFIMDLEAYHVGAFKALNPNLSKGLSLDERIQRIN